MKGLTPAELLAWKKPYQTYIISNDILLAGGTLGIYGAEGVWKSMISLDLTFRMSTGTSWLGLNTFLSPTFYLQSEIPQGPLQTRTLKYMLGNSIQSENCWLCTELYEKIDKGWGYTELEKEVARCVGLGMKVLIIDPIYNSIAANLVDDYEVGLFLDRMNMLRSKYNIAIILIHHNRQMEHSEGVAYNYGTDEWFGSSRFKRWLDTMIYVELTNDSDPLVSLRLTFQKVRHAETLIKPIDIVADRRDLSIKLRTGGMV